MLIITPIHIRVYIANNIMYACVLIHAPGSLIPMHAAGPFPAVFSGDKASSYQPGCEYYTDTGYQILMVKKNVSHNQGGGGGEDTA